MKILINWYYSFKLKMTELIKAFNKYIVMINKIMISYLFNEILNNKKNNINKNIFL